VWEQLDYGRLVKTNPGGYSSYQEWKMRTIVSMNPGEHYLAGLLGGLVCVDSGVTSVLDYAHGQINQENAVAAAKGLQDSGVAGWFAFQLGVSSSYKPGDTVDLAHAHSERISSTTETHWATVDALKRDVFTDPNAVLQLGLAPAAGIGDKLDLIKEEWGRARATGVNMIAAHIHKPGKPLPAGYMGFRDSGMLDLADAGLLGPDYHISHANRLTDDEFKVLRETGGMVCATAMGEFPYMTSASRGPSCHGRARKAGVATGIGIDVIMALSHDYFEHARAAFWNLYLEPEGVAIASSYKSPDVLDFVTNLGAKAIRLGDVAGSIEVGKRADLVCVDLSQLETQPLHHVVSQLVYATGRQQVSDVWIDGVAKLRQRVLVDMDIDAIVANARQWRQRIAAIQR